MSTPNMGIPQPSSGDKSNDVIWNEAVWRFVMTAQPPDVETRVNTVDGQAKVEGAKYVISSSPTGSDAGFPNTVVGCYGGQWRRLTPWEGYMIYRKDLNYFETFNGSSWVGDSPT